MEKQQTYSQPHQTALTEQRRKLLIGLFLVVALFYWLGLYLYMPILPTYVQSRVNNLALVGTILSMYGLWQVVMRLPTGIMADVIGRRKPFIVGGMLLVGAGAWILGSADSAFGLLVGRSLTGVAAATWVPLIAAFSLLFKPGEVVRATAIITLVSSCARILATMLSGVVNAASGTAAAFQLAAVVAWGGMLLMLFIPENAWPTARRFNLHRLIGIVTQRGVIVPALMNAAIQYGDWTATYSFLPILAKQFGATEVMQSTLLSFNMVLVLLGNVFTASLVKRFSTQTLTKISFIAMALGVGMAALASSLAVVFLAQALVGLSLGIGYPILMGLSIDLIGDDERTIAMGLHQSVYALGMFAGPWLSGIIANHYGISPMFVFTGIGLLLLGFVFHRLVSSQNE